MSSFALGMKGHGPSLLAAAVVAAAVGHAVWMEGRVEVARRTVGPPAAPHPQVMFPVLPPLGPGAAVAASELELRATPGGAAVRLSELRGGRPAVLVFGLPRATPAQFAGLRERYRGRVEFVFVGAPEHPTAGTSARGPAYVLVAGEAAARAHRAHLVAPGRVVLVGADGRTARDFGTIFLPPHLWRPDALVNELEEELRRAASPAAPAG